MDAVNPFDDCDGRFVVLANGEGQHSIWPAFAAVPPGWTIVHSEDDRSACFEYVEQHWTDMRPRSLIEAMRDSGPSLPTRASRSA